MIAIAAALALLPCAFAGLGMGLATGKVPMLLPVSLRLPVRSAHP